MPLFTHSSPYDADVERATSELNASDDLNLIREVCEKIKQTPSGAKDCFRSIVKRMNHKVPHVALQALSLLDACVRSCGYAFHIEVASRDFVSECRTFITSGKPHGKVVLKLKMLIKRWAENEFRTDPALNIIPSMYNSLKSEGHSFPSEDVQFKETTSSITKKEEDDIAKAIAMSLKEAEKSTSKSPSLYPNVGGAWSSSSASSSSTSSSRDLRKVRTLYDFEAAEDNELTFKAGEIIGILDDSDPNWWKGSSWRGEGLFPANFVTADLTAEPEPEINKARKSVHFQEEVDVKILEPAVAEVVEIDEAKIDRALTMIQNADPTGEINPDPADLVTLEEQCKGMLPLIDQELERIDRQHIQLMEYNMKLMDAFKMYNSLMSELPNYGYVMGSSKMAAPSQPAQHMFPGPQYLPGQVPMSDVNAASLMGSQPQQLGYGPVTAMAPAQSNMPNTYQSYGNEVSQNQPSNPSFAPVHSFQYVANNGYQPELLPSAPGMVYNSAGPDAQAQQAGYMQLQLATPNLL